MTRNQEPPSKRPLLTQLTLLSQAERGWKPGLESALSFLNLMELSPSPPSPPLQAALEGSCSLSARAALSPLLSLEQQLLGSHTVSLLPAPIRKSLLLTSLRATLFPF